MRIAFTLSLLALGSYLIGAGAHSLHIGIGVFIVAVNIATLVHLKP